LTRGGLDAVQLHHVVDAHAVASQQAVDQAASGDVAVEADERLAVERGEGRAGPARGGVPRRRRDDELVVRSRARAPWRGDAFADLTLLDALDGLDEGLVTLGEPPIAFDGDCREGICGACGIVVDGRFHGPLPETTTRLLPLRAFREGATVTLEPFRTGAVAVVRDLVVDRGARDRIVQAGGYVSVRAGWWTPPIGRGLAGAHPTANARRRADGHRPGRHRADEP
jgi:hypothetical protein